jgi:hypothetical protein
VLILTLRPCGMILVCRNMSSISFYNVNLMSGDGMGIARRSNVTGVPHTAFYRYHLSTYSLVHCVLAHKTHTHHTMTPRSSASFILFLGCISPFDDPLRTLLRDHFLLAWPGFKAQVHIVWCIHTNKYQTTAYLCSTLYSHMGTFAVWHQ